MNKLFPEHNKYSLDEYLSSYSKHLQKALESIDSSQLNYVFEALEKGIDSQATIYTCGNGGSSAIAEHLVCDFVKGASTDSNIQPKVVPLLSTPIVTAIANDVSYDEIFAFQIEKYGNEKDILLSVSSSGNSPNIINAINTAKKMSILTISLVGFDGGRAKDISDLALHVNANNYGICEDAHHALMHIFAQYLRFNNIDDNKKIGQLKF